MKLPKPAQQPQGPLEFDLTADDQALFLAETDELLRRVEESLVALEHTPDDARLLNDIFRAAHTIKGSSATIGHGRMAALTHAMETRLDEVRTGAAPVTAALVEGLLRSLDVLNLLRDEVETRQQVAVDVESAIRALEPEGAPAMAPASSNAPARPVAGATHRIIVALEPGAWVAVRALQALLALGERGAVLSSQPTQAEIERAEAGLGDHLTVLLRSDEAESALHAALAQVPELGSVSIERLTPAPAEQPLWSEVPARAAEPVPLPTAEPQTPPLGLGSSAASKTIRIDVARLDALLNLVGELVIDRTRLVQIGASLANRLDRVDARLLMDFQQTAMHVGRITDELQEQVMKSRMLPIDTVFSRLPRVVRDTAARLGKAVDFVVTGRDTELDRSIIEEIGDPLLHLIRNAVDHGLEQPEERVAAGKSATGTVRLSARHAESYILVSVEDDGSGIAVDAVKRKAVERGAMTQDVADRLSDHEAIQLIFHPGLSTAREVTDVSGRGVGMDVVRANVEKLNGGIEVSSHRGQGTRITIRLPLTLAILQALLVRVAGGIYALPIHAVTETLRIPDDQVHRVNHCLAMQLRGAVLPLLPLRRAFGLGDEEAPDVGAGQRLVVAVHADGGRQVGLVVDGLVGEQEIVIKPLGRVIGDVAGISGAAILGDGNVALIVDVPSLISRVVLEGATAARLPGDAQPRDTEETRRRGSARRTSNVA